MVCQHCISNSDDLIDSRNVIARIEELENDEDRTEEDDQELAALQALAAEASDYASDWKYGATLIRDSYFEEDAQQYVEDLYGIEGNDWPFTLIDWTKAAKDRKQDYTSVSFDGIDYWIR